MVKSKRSHRVKKRFLAEQDFGVLELLEKRHALEGSILRVPEELGWDPASVEEREDEIVATVESLDAEKYGGSYQLNFDEDGTAGSFFEAFGNDKSGRVSGGRLPLPEKLFERKTAGTVQDVAGDGRYYDYVFWQAKSRAGEKTPVVLYFHGGGFVAGGKNQVSKKLPVASLLRNGISVMSVDYTLIKASDLLGDPNSDYAAYKDSNFFSSGRTKVGQLKGYMRYLNRNAEDPYASQEPFQRLKGHLASIVSQCNRWINFVESKAQDWNLDVTRIGLAGSSAGALIANWLGHRAVAVAVRDLPVMTEELVTEPLAGFGSLSGRSADDLPPLWIRQGEGASNDLHAPENASHLEALYSSRSREAVFEKYGSSKNLIPKPLAGQTAVDFFSRHLLAHE